jgi:hypothetical protein
LGDTSSVVYFFGSIGSLLRVATKRKEKESLKMNAHHLPTPCLELFNYGVFKD